MTRQGPEVKSESSVNSESKRANPPTDRGSHGVGDRRPHQILALMLAWIGCGSTFSPGNSGASASDFSVLHAFGEVPYFSVGNEDGAQPKAGLVVAENALFGTTSRGGTKGNGTLFKVGMDGRGFTVLHHFIYADGLQIERALVSSGSMLYGAASQGGTGKGAVFACSKDGATFKALHAFNGSDGSYPDSLLLLDGHLYGNAILGGTYSNGTLYRMDLDGSNFQVLHHFKDVTDGMGPSGTLVQMDGILFGTTRGGMARGYSTVFRFDPTSAQLSAIYHFETSEVSESGLAVSGGMLFGTLSNPNAGTVFKLGPDGSGFKILHKFDGDADGSSPSLLSASGAMLFGTASSGGPGHHGTIYGVKEDGTAFKTLYSFPLPNMNNEGSMPLGSVAISGSKLYGTTFGAGASGEGVVFSLSIEPQQPAPNDKPVTGPDPVISDRVTRLESTTGSAGSTVTIPITFVAKGNENSVGFSLTFPSNQATFGGLTLGAGANGASLVLNTNQAASTPARVGLVLFWPVNQTIAPGTQSLATLTLQISAGLPVGTIIPVQFTNSPASKSASDTLGNDVALAFTDGTITVGAAGYEGDVAPRPNGNGVINAGDLTVLGRIVAGLDSAPTGAELQRADCAPRSSLGNGIINAGDLTQLARYVAGLDPQSPVGGPTTSTAGPAGLTSGSGSVARKSVGARRFTVGDGSMAAGSTGVVTVKMTALGDENALSFSLSFDPARMTYRSAAVVAAVGANLLLNTNLAPIGKLGVVISLPAGQVASAATFDLLNVTFQAGTAPGAVALAFGNSPASKSISDALGNDLTATFTDGTVTIQGSGQAPVITSSPQSQTAGVGSTVTLSASASGTAPLTYQWQKNGVPIANAIAATLTLSNFQSADVGSYTVVVSNAYGSATSQAGLVTLTPVVVSSRRLAMGNTTLNAGVTGLATVQMTAQGDENALSFSLSFDPARLTYRSAALGAGATGANLVLNTNLAPIGKLGVVISLPAGQVASAGTFDLLNVTFQSGTTPGAVALVFGNSPAPQSMSDLLGNDLSCQFVDGAMTIVGSVQTPVITTQPQSQTLPSGSTATFTVAVAGSGPWTYQWYRGDLTLTDGPGVAGAIGTTLTLQNLKPSDNALIKVVVTGTGGSAEASARLTVTEPSSPVPGLVIPRFYTRTSELYSQLRAAIPRNFDETSVNCSGMNNQGEIFGYINTSNPFAKLKSGIVLLDDVYKRDLESRTSLTEGISAVENMNASGDIVGILRYFNPSPNFAGPNRVFLFRNGRMTNLGAPTADGFNLALGYGQSGVLQINNSDQVLAGNEFFSRKSWIIDLKSGQWILLTPDGSDWAARGLNDLGEVVGQYTKSKKGAIWSGGVLREIPNNPGKSAGFNTPLYIGNDGRIIWSSGHVTDRDGNIQQTLRPNESIGIFASHNIKITGQNIVMYPPGDSNLSLWKGADYVTYNGQLGRNNASYYPYLPNSVPSLMFSDIDDSGRLLASWFGIMTPSVPLILDQPQTVRVREGAAASLSVTVAGALITTSGDGILGAWHRDATEPEGKVSQVFWGDSVTWTNRLTIAAVRIQHAGDYYFVATNVSGVVTSAVARIEVISLPRITRQPDDVTAFASSTVGFAVEASGVPTPDYQWRHNGIDLPGETGVSLTVSSVGLNSAGEYSVVVRNSEGSVVSRSALLTVKSLPSRRILVSQAPGDAPGSLTAVIQATAQGNENALSFSLAFDPARLTYVSAALGSGATGANFIANVNQAQSGQLGVVISLPAGQSLSAGSLDLLQVRFAPVGTPGKVPIRFAKTPAPISVSDVQGNDLICEFVDGSVGTRAGLSPTIENVRRDGDTLSATLTGFSAGATVILQKSSNLRDWADAQTFTASGGSISIQRPIQSNEAAEYLRFLVR